MFEFVVPDKQRVSSVTVSPNDAYVAGIHTDRSVSTVWLWLMREPAPPKQLMGGVRLDRLAWSSNSRYLAGVSHARQNAKGDYMTLAFGTGVLAASDSSGRRQVVRLPSGERPLDKRVGRRDASALAFAPDGTLYVATENKVWIYSQIAA